MVAPMKVNKPLSTCGKKASCWLLLKRCTSSTNTMVACGARPSCAAWARSTASRMSFTPPSTALMVMNCASNACAISRAMVVLPVPGGPQRMQLCGCPDSNASRSGMPSPSRCCCPTTCARVRGRRRSGKGTWRAWGMKRNMPYAKARQPCAAALPRGLAPRAPAPCSFRRPGPPPQAASHQKQERIQGIENGLCAVSIRTSCYV